MKKIFVCPFAMIVVVSSAIACNAMTINLTDNLDLSNRSVTILDKSHVQFDGIGKDFQGKVTIDFDVTYDIYRDSYSFTGLELFQGNASKLGIGNNWISRVWSAFGGPLGSNPDPTQGDIPGNIPVVAGDCRHITVVIDYVADGLDNANIFMSGAKKPLNVKGDHSFDNLRLRTGNEKATQVDFTNIRLTIDGEKISFNRKEIPEPIFSANPDLVELYWVAWSQAYDHVKTHPELPCSPYMDEAFSDDVNWIWDTAFMTLFCKYSPKRFPGVESLENFYIGLHEPEDPPVAIRHPCNPPLFAWAEYENFCFTKDKKRIKKLLKDTRYLEKHYNWIDSVKPGPFPGKSLKSVHQVYMNRQVDGWNWTGCASGMDNTPRTRGGNSMLWVDAIAQQGLSALCIARLAKAIGDDSMASDWMAKYETLKEKVNRLYWNEEDGLYYDIVPDGQGGYRHSRVKTPASFWPMLAEMASQEQVERMIKYAIDPQVFGGVIPWPTVSRNDRDFSAPEGRYWKGSIWLPTGYMAIKALEKGGQQAIADETAEALLCHMLKTYKDYEPHTIWECYSPTLSQPATHGDGKTRVRPDFCGWSALGPISLFIENVLGFHTIDAEKNEVHWRLHQKGTHGIKQLKFGNMFTDIMTNEQGNICVKSNYSYTLFINGKAYPVKSGTTEISLDHDLSQFY